MRMAVAVAVVCVSVGFGLPSSHVARTAAASPVAIVVTSSADVLPTAACPDASRCTLRKAIEMANLDVTASAVAITFNPTIFPPTTPASVTVGATPLPIATRADLTLDGSGSGVRIAGTTTAPASMVDGLVLTGARTRVAGIAFEHFTGACLKLTGIDGVIGGNRGTGHGNTFGDCSTGVRADGANVRVHGNSAGFARDGITPAAVSLGIAVSASDAVVGDDGQGPGYQNRVGNAQVGVLAGGAGAAPVTGIKISGNTIGQASDGSAAPVTTAIRIAAPVTSAQVSANNVSNALTGVALQGSAGGPSAQGVRITANAFSQIGHLSVDLNEDDQTNPNDEGDADTGANGLRNYPRLTRVVQSRISGTACPGCQVQLYLAAHSPGGSIDFGATPVPGGLALADAAGSFSFESPAVTPGQWVTALATDAQGDTSEFSPGSRVGAGSIQCGNGALEPGWNLVGYFGAEAVNLGASFPTEGIGAGRVRAIYHLDPATGAYSGWFADAAVARTLLSVEPGEAYWFLADAPVPLSGGFSLSSPIPVALKAGWNTVVYIGASAPVADAFVSLGTNYREVYAWVAADDAWSSFSTGETPAWAQGFTEAQACRAFQLFSTADTTLMPLQP